MSKEILLNFDTIFWVVINWKKNYSYVTRLKSRIYKARIKKTCISMQKSHIKFATSLSTKLIIVDQIVLKNITWYNINDRDKLYIAYKYNNTILLKLGKFKNFSLLAQQLNYCLLLFILEPQWTAKLTFSTIHFVSLLHPYQFSNFIELESNKSKIKQMYFVTFNCQNLVPKINNNYLITKLNLQFIFSLQAQNCIARHTSSNIIKNLHKIDLLKLNNNSFQYVLANYIGMIIIYCLCVETSSVYRSNLCNKQKLFFNKFDIQIYYYGLQIIISHSDNFQLYLWSIIFSQVIYYYTKHEIIIPFVKSKKYSIDSDFCGYSITWNKYYQIIYFPNKLFQFTLLLKIKEIVLMNKNSNSTSLTLTLNCLIESWVNYFQYSNSMKVFILIDYLIYLKLLSWIFRKHSNWGKNQIKRKYFVIIINNFLYKKYTNWLFHTPCMKQPNQQKVFILKLTLLSNFFVFAHKNTN
uniref:Group II intron maturase-specific domain-containing protein n=1 Tax=Kumanoa americana TaxID=1196377 RepID=A0A1C9CGC6_9FLOR|nr:hypothetical protein Kuma_014 [Kumanoa americana]AOM67448.1 hypothetical protein Kuma_014 [Kumanoa americana]